MSKVKKVQVAVEYIESHLTQKLDLDRVAAATHYSKYHLHRMFSTTLGLTVHEYIQRRQLTEAAKLLTCSDRLILDIALLAGYESQQAFSVRFKEMYKQAPHQYREGEKFYPLQWPFAFAEHDDKPGGREAIRWKMSYGSEEDIPCWMALVRLVVDGFPHLHEEEYLQILKERIRKKQALILKEKGRVIAIMLFSEETGSIDFLGIHPMYRRQGAAKAFLDQVRGGPLKGKDISITTFREGDKSDTGHREQIKKMGFQEAELLLEFGYPTQRFILPMVDDVNPLQPSHEGTAVDNGAGSSVDLTFPDEIVYLAKINEKLDEALQKADAGVERKDREYMETKRYMVQYRGEIDPHEMFQNELALKQIDRAGAFSVGVREKIARLKGSPYFARIDFQEKGDQGTVSYYIGSSAFVHQEELLICDWRSPVASMFYDCPIGSAGYDAPAGKVAGELTRKRQFSIKEGKLIYVLESGVHIQDDVLQQELSKTADEKMKSIIATIQQEQNQIIRNEKAKTMVIQGVAGSGKTSVALHRIAFLLYRFKDKLSARNITILSPNKVFGDYISNVLPELGEEPIYGLSLTDIAAVQLKGIMDVEADKDHFAINDEQWAERVRFKSTLDFVKGIDQFLAKMPDMVFAPEDYVFGRFVAKADWIVSRFQAYHRYSVNGRLERVAEDIVDRFAADNLREEELPRVRVIFSCLKKMLRVKNTLSLYKYFFQQMGISHLLVLPGQKTLEWADVFPFLYFHAAFTGLQESRGIKHLVIDEMQDYTPVQYAVLNLLFSCQKTILGDFGQRINPNHLHTLSDLQQIYVGAEFVQLNKSYRSTYEIMHFAKRIQLVDQLEPMARHGEPPVMQQCRNKEDELDYLKRRIATFPTGGSVSLAIITKTNEGAKALSDLLAKGHDIHLISPKSNHFVQGISITSIQMSKGLEFDEVILPDVDDVTYVTDGDRGLLYIACTRAMHKLTLLYTGKQSKLID